MKTTEQGGSVCDGCRRRAAFFLWLSTLILLLGTVLMVHASSPRFAGEPSYVPDGMTITWHGDPRTTMTVQWLGSLRLTGEEPERSASQTGVWWAPVGQDTWQWVAAESKPWELRDIPGYVTDKISFEMSLYRAAITGLEPGTSYRFRVGTDSPEYRFRTAPERLDEPLVFVSGGDVYVGTWPVRTHRQAASHSPLFALIGGDLSYADGHRTARKIQFLREWHENMVTPDGYLIPFLAAIGNHEVTGGRDFHSRAPFFAALFDGLYQDGLTYNTVDFGDYLSLILLDTGHINPVEGAQTAWLEQALSERRNRPHRFVFYHVPGWPSHRPFEGRTESAVREHWVPLFEQYGVHTAFEHHDHTYKRTHPLWNGAVDHEKGIVYIGDGAWGVGVRRVKRAEDVWYLAKTAEERHFIKTTIRPDGSREHVVIDVEGNVIDRIPAPDGE